MLACSIRAKSVHNDDRPFQICEGMVIYEYFGSSPQNVLDNQVVF
jgi:hypothetical protein